MTHIMFARWFGIVSLLISLGILFNLEDAYEMAKRMAKDETGYIMGGVLPIIFGSLSLMFVNGFDLDWDLAVTAIGAIMLAAGIYRVMFVNQWKAFISKHLEQIPFLFSLFGCMLGVVLIYIGYIAPLFEF
ncbi:MAG: hypothetical protein A3E84_00480 [Gammaproteobacteria bacterium RIFCSPHIGHO2_12_FULL_42_13]|nr:MAG: hypothetical protein A3E84_00480 [Gammaproteobacteria bacterium RIFCSPHIGHO2_12_FULL_42_13]